LKRASRLDAFSAYPFPTWLPGDAPSGTAGTPERFEPLFLISGPLRSLPLHVSAYLRTRLHDISLDFADGSLTFNGRSQGVRARGPISRLHPDRKPLLIGSVAIPLPEPSRLETCCGYRYGQARNSLRLRRIFKDHMKRTRHHRNRGALRSQHPYLRLNLIQGLDS